MVFTPVTGHGHLFLFPALHSSLLPHSPLARGRALAAAQPELLHGRSVLLLIIVALSLAQVLVAAVLALVLLEAAWALKGPLLRGCLAVPLIPRCRLGAVALRLGLGLADLRRSARGLVEADAAALDAKVRVPTGPKRK